MTRTDLFLAIHKAETKEDWENLALILHTKVEAAYGLLFALEKAAVPTEETPSALETGLKELAQRFRKDLEK